MRKKSFAIFASLLIGAGLHAQHVISGLVTNRVTKKPIPVVSVTVKESSEGDFTNDNGNFKINTSKKFPLTLIFSFIGFESKELVLNSAQNSLSVQLDPASSLGQEVVVSASRSTMRKLESPVTIERIGNKDIINSPQINYFDMLQGLKGVDVTV